MRWELIRALDWEAVESLLKDGWEPFAVEKGEVYFRRQKLTVEGNGGVQL